jgi:hypothetical protein
MQTIGCGPAVCIFLYFIKGPSRMALTIKRCGTGLRYLFLLLIRSWRSH